MAARSYLSRIAQPLIAADPVVWSTPRAAVDETRPAARPTLAPYSPPSASRRPDPAVEAPPPSPPLPRVAQDQPRLAAADFPLARDAPTAAAPRIPIAASIETSDRLDVLDPTPSPVARSPRDVGTAGPDTESRGVASATSRVIDSVAASATGEAASRTPPSQADRRARDPEVSEAVAAPDASVAPPRTGLAAVASAAVPETPRLHIGAIEIRMTQPPAPTQPQTQAPIIMHAPPVAAPLARGYASRFGLAQG